MSRILGKIFVVAIAAIAALLQSCCKAQTTHLVGDALGWLVPPSADTYTTWAANQTFKVGDVLVFNFATGRHDVAQVTETAFNGCNASNPILRETNSPVNITLPSSGQFYYICTFPGHCSGGQKLMVNVSATASTAPQPSTSPSPINAPTPVPIIVPPALSPTRNPVTYVVGDDMGWIIPANTSVSYQNWARGKSFVVGDILVFNYALNEHDVAEVSKQAYSSCNSSNAISLNSSPPTRITLTTPGEHFFICTFPNHCSAGQQLAINVTGTATAKPPSPSVATPPSETNITPSAPTPTGVTTTPPNQPGNSAKSLNAAGLSFTVLAIIVVGLLY